MITSIDIDDVRVNFHEEIYHDSEVIFTWVRIIEILLISLNNTVRRCVETNIHTILLIFINVLTNNIGSSILFLEQRVWCDVRARADAVHSRPAEVFWFRVCYWNVWRVPGTTAPPLQLGPARHHIPAAAWQREHSVCYYYGVDCCWGDNVGYLMVFPVFSWLLNDIYSFLGAIISIYILAHEDLSQTIDKIMIIIYITLLCLTTTTTQHPIQRLPLHDHARCVVTAAASAATIATQDWARPQALQGGGQSV